MNLPVRVKHTAQQDEKRCSNEQETVSDLLYAVYSLQAGGAENGCRERILPYRAAEPRITAVHVIALSAELRNSSGLGRAGSAAVPFSAGAHLQTVRDILVYDLFFPLKRNLFSYGRFCVLSVRFNCIYRRKSLL